MVLRKPPPPRLENLNKRHARSETHSLASPSTSSPPFEGRARLNRIPSQESVYSPDLNTSPAFDLMPLEEAQRSPVGSATSQPSNSWPDSLEERALHGRSAGTGNQANWVSPARVPNPPQAETAEQDSQTALVHRDDVTWNESVQLQSNNPFLKPRAKHSGQNLADQSEWSDRYSHATASSGALSQSMKSRLFTFNTILIFCSWWIHPHDGAFIPV